MNEPTLRFVESNGIRMRIAESGTGPLVLLVHGWPESWYSWRNQLPALARAGFHAVAPDMRGYGKTDAPDSVEDYDILDVTSDLVGILDALNARQATLVGHDWGAIVAWQCMLLHPDRFNALVAMSVPYGGRPKQSLTTTWQEQYKDNFFYILYFQEPGVAEAEFDADPSGILSRLYVSPDTPREPPEVTDPKRSAGGWIKRLGAPRELPPWLSRDDLDYYINEFKHSGFRGGINYYRNFHRNWELTPQVDGLKVEQPVLFLAGEKDPVIQGANEQRLRAMMARATTDLQVKLFPDVGHWVQQEVPDQVNQELLGFLSKLPQ